jgi:transposase-like protein
MSSPDPVPGKRKRRRSGTAKWHMSRAAVDMSLPQIYAMEDKECLQFLARARWGSVETVRCPHCGTISTHYFRPLERRWKCRACDRAFSVTSDTVFADRKLKLQDIIAGALLWINSAAGQPALELKRHFDKTYNTAFTLQHKMREALMRGYNIGFLSGDIEMDGAHQSGKDSVAKRGRPQTSQADTKDTPREELQAAIESTNANTANELQAQLESTGVKRQKRRNEKKKKSSKDPDAPRDPDTRQQFPSDRRQFITVRKRSGVRGYGAAASKVAIAREEEPVALNAVISDFVANGESFLNSDGLTPYVRAGKQFIEHRQVNHGATLIGANGENNNLSEELNFRMDRAEQGVYLNLEPKYLLDYAVETAFRADTRHMPNGSQLQIALHLALNVGLSRFWRGYTHGRHRTVELTHPHPAPAKASGPAKGRNPRSPSAGRPPR